MSLPEILLWRALRQRPDGYKFRRQFPLHPFVLDFACLQARLCIEVDGEAHSRGDQPSFDAGRDAQLERLGFTTLRIPAVDVLHNLDGVVIAIGALCRKRGSRPVQPLADAPLPETCSERNKENA